MSILGVHFAKVNCGTRKQTEDSGHKGDRHLGIHSDEAGAGSRIVPLVTVMPQTQQEHQQWELHDQRV